MLVTDSSRCIGNVQPSKYHFLVFQKERPIGVYPPSIFFGVHPGTPHPVFGLLPASPVRSVKVHTSSWFDKLRYIGETVGFINLIGVNMQHATISQQLQVWQAFLIEETWAMQPLSVCLADILTGSAPVDSGTVNPDLSPGDLDARFKPLACQGMRN